MDGQQLIAEIQEAFKEVALKDGIGINEADKIEVGERDAFRQKGRNVDRLWWRSWSEIEDKYIASYSSVMDFMDAEGLRWALPAYMIYIINHYKEGSFSVDSTIYILEGGALGSDNRDLYTAEQKRVIAQFLQYMLTLGDEWVDVGSAQMALDKVWGAYL
ncbi:MAG: hypothetical protein KJO45_07105 [Sulfurovum sp.]|nr:hypothetical protein [Sulfurovum sp.]